MKHKTMLAGATALALTVLVYALPTTAADTSASKLWLHVHVQEDGNENVRVNLPLSVAEKSLAMVPQDVLDGGQLKIDNHQIQIGQLREIWHELQTQPDFVLASVESDTETVHVSKEGGYLLVRVHEQGAETAPERVQVRIPERVVDALLSGTGDQLNIQAAFEALVAHGEGELVTVEEATSRVRIWVDGIAEAR